MTATHDAPNPDRRDFLFLATGAAAAAGAAFVAWPFVAQMNPDASELALSSTELDLSQIAEGQVVTIKWRGKPVFVWHRTKDQIEKARDVKPEDLVDPLARNENLPPEKLATDENRAAPGKEKWLIVVGVCTHLGCVPLANSGDYGGWLCPCHGSHYDGAGRIRRGPAPQNLDIPPYAFESDTKIKIG